jgi:hypothetical protein
MNFSDLIPERFVFGAAGGPSRMLSHGRRA